MLLVLSVLAWGILRRSFWKEKGQLQCRNTETPCRRNKNVVENSWPKFWCRNTVENMTKNQHCTSTNFWNYPPLLDFSVSTSKLASATKTQDSSSKFILSSSKELTDVWGTWWKRDITAEHKVSHRESLANPSFRDFFLYQLSDYLHAKMNISVIPFYESSLFQRNWSSYVYSRAGLKGRIKVFDFQRIFQEYFIVPNRRLSCPLKSCSTTLIFLHPASLENCMSLYTVTK